MGLIDKISRKKDKIDFLFPNSFEELMNNEYYDYDKFEWFIYYLFELEGVKVEKVGKKGKGDGGVDIILSESNQEGYVRRIGIQAKYWKNRVGVEPIRQLSTAKEFHDLSELWIITTSDLTNDAKETAEKLKIQILRADDVKGFIEEIKERHRKDIESKGESRIEFLIPKIKDEPTTSNKEKQFARGDNNSLIEPLKKLRIELANKYKITPLYNVFNNETLEDIVSKNPTSIDNLFKVKGLGKKKVELFGQELVDFLVEYEKQEQLYQLLIKERVKISKYNKIDIKLVYSDDVARKISIKMPINKEMLSEIEGFSMENMDVFGDYLIKVISKFLDSTSK